MDQGLNRKPNGWALLPFLIFIVIYLGAGLFLQRCEHALRAVKAVVVISNGGFLNTHGSLSPFLSDCL